jgi:large subunit ribosomal protein L27
MSIFKLDLQFFAQKKGGGSASTNCSHKSYNPKNLGVKVFGGEYVRDGNIIVCQRGTKFRIKENDESVYFGKTKYIHANHDGIVSYYYRKIKRKERTFVTVLPLAKKPE